MDHILDLSRMELQEKLNALDMKSYAAKQVFSWIYQKNELNPDLWSNLSKSHRAKIKTHFTLEAEKVESVDTDDSGTRKILLRLRDNKAVEAVLIPEKNHYTFCISSQVGCPLKCAFCATGKMGFLRNLTSGEILAQVIALKKETGGFSGKTNIVFMGMGEPLLNVKEVEKALEILISPQGMGFPARNITVSTAGIMEKLADLEKAFPGVKISFSLHGTTNEQRRKLMPVAAGYSIDDIMDYFRTTRRIHRVTFEYVMVHDGNDSAADARRLSRLLRGIYCKVNLIPYNPVAGLDFRTPSESRISEFEKILTGQGLVVTVRYSKGRDIRSACGQLATDHQLEKSD